MTVSATSNLQAEKPIAAMALGLGVRGLPGLETFLGCPVGRPGSFFPHREGQVVLAWGHRPSARKAQRYAARHGLPLWRLEDGFIRSLGLGNMATPIDVAAREMGWSRSDAPLSLVVDDVGIHYDSTKPSRLEAMVARKLESQESARAHNLIERWRIARVSKYNHARDLTAELPKRFVLVADQTWGDPSIRYGQADTTSFQRMLDAALAENPECEVVLKVHPQVYTGRKKGHFDLAAISKLSRVTVLGQDAHVVSLLEKAEAVYAVTSQIGFEGLLWGKRVHVFGLSFYAGYGLTQDALPAPVRRQPVPLEKLVHAALVDYSRYVDPETGERCEAERVLEWLGLQRRMRERFPVSVYAAGFSPWKKPIVKAYLAGSRVEFVDRVDAISAGSTLIVWGRKPLNGTVPDDVDTVRLEDGFLRSVGLGADLVWPLSWVMDRRGIYYDATQPSDLEYLLQTEDFSDELRYRASQLRERIVASRLTKYNVGGKGWTRPDGFARVILVPGQVESDASIRLGTVDIRTNVDLLRAVRRENPDAYVIYKPHPDVIAGLRRGGEGEAAASTLCDDLVTEINVGDLLPMVDEVHVLTSLAGFEGLLRHKRVVCYGQPFYAGWGLTTDRTPPTRRTRKLTLDELVAGTLILYPTYLSQTTRRFTTPERILEELITWRERGPTTLPAWRKVLRWMLQLRAN